MDQNTDSATMSPAHVTGNGDVANVSIPAGSADMPPTYAPSSDLPPSYPPLAAPKDRGTSDLHGSSSIADPVSVSGQAKSLAPIIVVSGNYPKEIDKQGNAGQITVTASKQTKKGRKTAKSGRGFGLLETLAFLIGLGIFLYPLLAAYVNYYQDSSAMDNYDQIVEALSPAPVSYTHLTLPTKRIV